MLDIFRANDRRSDAAGHLHDRRRRHPAQDRSARGDEDERNIGKVATLALGFGGSIGALQRMALNYRINLDDAEARRIVTAWREANPWARNSGARTGKLRLWGAALSAWELHRA